MIFLKLKKKDVWLWIVRDLISTVSRRCFKMWVITSILSAIFLITAVWADELIFVSVLHRHGDRSPIITYPNNPHPLSTWRNGLGQLTNMGKNQTYQLGKYIRERYKDFLPSEYHENDIQVMSSDLSRTLMSAYCVLAGLYEPQGEDIWMEPIKWQPIPVRSLPRNLDNLIYINNAYCPKFHRLLNENVFEAKSKIVNEYKDIVAEISTHAGLSMPNETLEVLILGLHFHDCLAAEERRGLEIPKWTQKFYPEPLHEIAKFTFSMRASDQQLQRLRCGPMLKDILIHMENARQGLSKVKMWLYSGHDHTIIDMLQSLNVFDGDLVPFAGAIFFELYKAENDFEVVIYYKKNEQVIELKIPGCKSHCPLDKFKELIKNVVPENWKEECKL